MAGCSYSREVVHALYLLVYLHIWSRRGAVAVARNPAAASNMRAASGLMFVVFVPTRELDESLVSKFRAPAVLNDPVVAIGVVCAEPHERDRVVDALGAVGAHVLSDEAVALCFASLFPQPEDGSINT